MTSMHVGEAEMAWALGTSSVPVGLRSQKVFKKTSQELQAISLRLFPLMMYAQSRTPVMAELFDLECEIRDVRRRLETDGVLSRASALQDELAILQERQTLLSGRIPGVRVDGTEAIEILKREYTRNTETFIREMQKYVALQEEFPLDVRLEMVRESVTDKDDLKSLLLEHERSLNERKWLIRFITADDTIVYWGRYGDGVMPRFAPKGYLRRSLWHHHTTKKGTVDETGCSETQIVEDYYDLTEGSREIREYLTKTVIPAINEQLALIEAELAILAQE